jgi:hypothetical protein
MSSRPRQKHVRLQFPRTRSLLSKRPSWRISFLRDAVLVLVTVLRRGIAVRNVKGRTVLVTVKGGGGTAVTSFQGPTDKCQR